MKNIKFLFSLAALLLLLLAACGPKPGQNPPGNNPNPPGSGPNPPNTPPGPETTAEIGKDGGTIKTENAELTIPADAIYGNEPAKITLKDLPLEAPGPVPEQATLIAAAEVWRANPFDDHFANFFNNPAPLRLSLRHAVAPARNSTHYTEVCSWIGEDGDGWGNKNYWFCHLSDIGPGTDRKGQGYIEVELAGLGGMHQNYYVFQFPKAWADENCRKAGGILYNEVDFHSFKDACHGRSEGRVSQIGQLLAPERLGRLSSDSHALPQDIGTISVLTWNVGQARGQCFYKLCDKDKYKNIAQLLATNKPSIITLQEMMVEDTYCFKSPPPKDKKTKVYCDINHGYKPKEPRAIDTILDEWKRLDPSVQLDYYCEQYECTIVNTAAFTFAGADKREYFTGGAADTGYFWTQLLSADGSSLDLFNAHLASPADFSPIDGDIGNNILRSEQINFLTRFLKSLREQRGAEANVLVIGDHNLCLPCAPLSEGPPEVDDSAISRQVSIVTYDKYHQFSWYRNHPIEEWPNEISQHVENESLALLHLSTRNYLGTGWVGASRMIDFPVSNRYHGECRYPSYPLPGGVQAIRTSKEKDYFNMDHNAIACDLQREPVVEIELMATRCGVPSEFKDGDIVYVVGTGVGVQGPVDEKISLLDIASTEASTWYKFEKTSSNTYKVEIPGVFLPNAPVFPTTSTPAAVLACPGGDLSKCNVAKIEGDEKLVFVELSDPQQCTINYLLSADAGWGAVPEDDFDFVGLPDPNPDDQNDSMSYELTLPNWLRLEPATGSLNPGQRFSEVINVDTAQALCDGAVEKEGKIRVRTQNPELEFEVPVRLMCAELDVRFEPESYNGGLPSVEPEKRCGRVTGTVTVRGADHLQEMFAYDVYDGAGNYIETRYSEPLFDFIAEHANYTTYRFPWTGEYDVHRPDEAHDWDWSTFPEIPFFSWTTSCALDEGEHQVNTFYLVHPKSITDNPRIDRRASSLSAPTGFTIEDNRFPGAIYNGARFCEPDGNGGEVCTEADALVQITVPGRVDLSIPIEYGNWEFGLLPPLNQAFSETIRLSDSGGNVLVDDVIAIPDVIPPDRLRYCRFNRTNVFLRSDESSFGVDGVPPVFWTQNIELHRSDGGAWYTILVESVAPWACYEPWDHDPVVATWKGIALRRGGMQALDALRPIELRSGDGRSDRYLRFIAEGASLGW